MSVSKISQLLKKKEKEVIKQADVLMKQKDVLMKQKDMLMKKVFKQEKAKAGLLVTGELDRAIARDLEFDIENDKERCLHSLNTPPDEVLKPADVLRVSEIFDDPKFYIDGAHASDIVQGALGDCWFLSGLGNISTNPHLLENICVARDEKVGVYGFIFYRDRGWVDVIIDDLLYISSPKYEELTPAEKGLYHNNKAQYNKIARKGNKCLYFAQGGTENETWVPLIEKAYAKLQGDYQALSGGQACEAIEDMTGGVCTFISTKDILDKDVFWKEELSHTDRLFGCANSGLDTTRGGATSYTTINGLIPSHAYSVLSAIECKGKRFVRVRNPWGLAEWNGPWSDGSKEWTKEWLDELPRLGHTFGNDGTFIMEYDDFLANWSVIDRTHLFDSSWVLSSQWLNVTTRPPPAAWNYGDVSFTITIPKATPAVIVLAQLDKRSFRALSGSSEWFFDFLLFKRGGKEPIAQSMHAYLHARSVNVEVELDEGEYIVHARLDRTISDSEEPDVPDSTTPPVPKPSPPVSSRKLSRVLTERFISQSIASNFMPEQYTGLLPLPLEVFAGHDLTELEVKHIDATTAKRKATADLLRNPSVTADMLPTDGENDGEYEPEPQAPDASGAPASFFSCDICTIDIIGPRYRDQDPARPNYDLCQECMDTGTHQSKVGWLLVEASSPPEGGAEPVHEGIICDGCKMEPLVGTRYMSQNPELPNVDLCQTCMDSGKYPKTVHGWLRLDIPLEGFYDGPAEPPAVHEGVACNICRTCPIVGVRYRCLETSCPGFDLCQNCNDKKVHPETHRLHALESPEDSPYSELPDDQVVLGLRVYTKNDAPAVVEGQLRHGEVIPWVKDGAEVTT